MVKIDPKENLLVALFLDPIGAFASLALPGKLHAGPALTQQSEPIGSLPMMICSGGINWQIAISGGAALF